MMMIRVMMAKQVTEVDVSVPFVLMLQEIVLSSRVAIASPVISAEQSKFLSTNVQLLDCKIVMLMCLSYWDWSKISNVVN